MSTVKCQRCDGVGKWEDVNQRRGITRVFNFCQPCNGTGRIDIPEPGKKDAVADKGPYLVTDEELKAVEVVVRDVCAELGGARDKFPAFNSAHEGWAVLAEEFSELWDEVKARDQDPRAMRAEAVQVAAMAMRFVLDVCDK